MRSRKTKNSSIGLCGRIAVPPAPDYELTGNSSLVMYIDVRRASGIVDRLPVAFKMNAVDSERLSNIAKIEDYNIRNLYETFYVGRKIMVIGEIRTYNSAGKRKISLFIWAEWITAAENMGDYNKTELIGRLCRDPRYYIKRKPICEMIIKAWNNKEKISIIPVLTWNSEAKKASDYAYSQRIKIYGRLQSRGYYKNGQTYTTYEVAAYKTEPMN